MKEILLQICKEYKYESARNFSGITLDTVLEIVAKQGNIVEEIRKQTGCAKQTVTNWLKNTFKDRDPIKDKSIFRFLLSKKSLKYCQRCSSILSYTEYYPNSSSSDGLQDYCKICSKSYRRESYNKNPEREKHLNSQRKRCRDINQTPKWANLSEIEYFYSNRPEGYHVDHIIPLKGALVSGLHVIENLQYLPKEENLSKGNKYTP